MKFQMRAVMALIAIAISTNSQAQQKKQTQVINILLTSDVHFGIKRQTFRGDTGVYSDVVNAAMVKQMNTLPGLAGPIDYFAITGDIANRMEGGVQTAAVSWAQFKQDYGKLNLIGHNGKPAEWLLVPGNHDVSDAEGFPRALSPATDPSSMIGIYNMMMKPAKPLTRQTFNYHKNKIDYSRNIGGVHFIFINIWPDSAQRAWMEKDLALVKPKTPVVIFTHDPPDADEKHFSSPSASDVASPGNTFEFMVDERYKEAMTPQKNQTDAEQRGWAAYLKKHNNIKAYFHGHSNWNEFYTYKGPDNDISLPVVRVDSPMKGKFSSKDETKLSFQLLSLDPKKQQLTVRECLWNTNPNDPKQGIVFGQKTTIKLKVD